MIYQCTVFTAFWKLEKFSLSSTSHYICISQPEFLFLLFPSGGPSTCMTSSTSSHFCAWRRTSQSSHYTTSTLPGQTSGYYLVSPSGRFKFLLLVLFNETATLYLFDNCPLSFSVPWQVLMKKKKNRTVSWYQLVSLRLESWSKLIPP